MSQSKNHLNKLAVPKNNSSRTPLTFLIYAFVAILTQDAWGQVPPIIPQSPYQSQLNDLQRQLDSYKRQQELRLNLTPSLPPLPKSPRPNCRVEVAEEIVYPSEIKGVEGKTWEILEAKHGLNAANFRDVIVDSLTKEGNIHRYDLQRVEIPGITAVANDNEQFAESFDQRVYPSSLADSEIGELYRMQYNPLRRLVTWIVGATVDIDALVMDIRGQQTSRGRKVLAPLQDKEIFELVVHSWGAELAFNAILNGVIRPPKQILVFAPPHTNMVKWAAMARQLRTEVRIFLPPQEMLHTDIALLISSSVIRGGYWVNIFPGGQVPDYSENAWRARWQDFCEEPSNTAYCSDYPRKDGFRAEYVPPLELENAGLSKHDRFAYYQYARKRGFLLTNPELMAREQEEYIEKKVREVINPLYKQAMDEARKELSRPRTVRTEREICIPSVPLTITPVPVTITPVPQPTVVKPYELPRAPQIEQPIQPEFPPPQTLPSCYMTNTPRGFRNMGGSESLGPYSSKEECESVNREYFNRSATCQCY